MSPQMMGPAKVLMCCQTRGGDLVVGLLVLHDNHGCIALREACVVRMDQDGNMDHAERIGTSTLWGSSIDWTSDYTRPPTSLWVDLGAMIRALKSGRSSEPAYSWEELLARETEVG